MPIDERSKAMYQPWNEEGFIADLRVRNMTQTQRWIYRTLLQQAFVCTTRPRLPDDDEELWMLADCRDLKQWLANKNAVIRMFDRIQIDGVPVLSKKRLEDDWARILDIREARAEAGRRSAEAKKAKANKSSTSVEQSATTGNKIQQVSKLSNEIEEREEEKEDDPFSSDEETDMRSDKLISIHCITILKTNADLSENNKLVLKALDSAYKGSVVAKAFETWAREHRHDEIRKPVSAFLKVADDLLSGEQTTTAEITENPTVKMAGREIAYISENKVALDHRDKALLKTAVEEEDYSIEEVVQAFRNYYDNLDTTRPNAVTFAGREFSQKAPDLLYAVRRKAAEKQREEAAVARTAEELSRKTQEDVQARLAALEREKQLADEELPE